MMTAKENIIAFTKKTLALAIAVGLITGLVEGILLFGLHQTNLLTWRLQNRAFWYETLWIAPLVDLILFALAGGFFALAGWLLPRLPIRKVSWFVFILLAVFDWIFIVLFGKISLVAIFILAIGISIQVFNPIMKREIAASAGLQKILPWLAGVAFSLFVVIQGGGWLNEKVNTSKLPLAKTETPNVIVIIVDTLRADHLSSYGYKRDTSPFIDSLAAQGVRFENAISSASWTQPSHASMLTGRYTYEHQAETKPLDNTYPTIGEVMQSNGYRSGAFSGNTEFFTRRQGFGRGFLHFEDNYKSVPDAFFNSSLYGFLFDFYGLRKALNYEGVPTRVLAPDINRSVLNWIDKDDTPFFVFINYFDVHDPYTPPEPYRSKYASSPNPGGLINGFMERYHPDLTPEQLQSEIDAYDGSISYVDDQIKALFSELEQRGLSKNTIVILTSDHGESLGEHGLLQHSASLYLNEIHVPLIVWGPGHVPSGKSIDTPVTLTALPSTILSLIGSSNNDPFPGPSLAILMSGDDVPADWPDPISEVAQFSGAAEQNPSTHGEMKSVIGTEQQYIVHEKFGEELYNWREDPLEENNIISEPSSQTVVDEFRNYLKNLIGELFKAHE
ncbi:MAG: sulfatase-like hydrolase/transferase [Anaerolineales bacterium]|nr:sulfatase-like hydrolase/transferase [Anaerolineales bacterium]